MVHSPHPGPFVRPPLPVTVPSSSAVLFLHHSPFTDFALSLPGNCSSFDSITERCLDAIPVCVSPTLVSRSAGSQPSAASTLSLPLYIHIYILDLLLLCFFLLVFFSARFCFGFGGKSCFPLELTKSARCDLAIFKMLERLGCIWPEIASCTA